MEAVDFPVRRVRISCAAVTLGVSLALAGCTGNSTSSSPSADTTHKVTPTATTSKSAPNSSARSSATATTSAAPTTSAEPEQPTPAQALAAAKKKAIKKIKPIQKTLGKGGISIEAVNTATGVRFSYGADDGMRTGSIIKLYILETLLLQHQKRGTHLTSYERTAATKMIENSDNAAAGTLFNVIGGKSGLNDVRDKLGVECTKVNGNHFGLTKTCASDFLNLVRAANAPGPLTEHSRDYILGLQAHIESDQRWGVSAAADDDTTTHLKNGWLDVDDDNGRWLINSVGSVTVHCDKVYLAVLTQHGPAVGKAYKDGQARVEKLAKIAADVVAPG